MTHKSSRLYKAENKAAMASKQSNRNLGYKSSFSVMHIYNKDREHSFLLVLKLHLWEAEWI